MSATVRSGKRPRRTVSALSGRLRRWADALVGPEQPGWKRLDAFNGLLGVAASLAALALLVWFGQPIAAPRIAVGEPSVTAEMEGADEPIAAPTRSKLDLGVGRFFVPSKTTPVARVQRANVTLSELSRPLKLLGVLGGDPPQAIVSHATTGQVLYLSPGEFVGEILVEEVRGSSVLLSWKDQTLELVL